MELNESQESLRASPEFPEEQEQSCVACRGLDLSPQEFVDITRKKFLQAVSETKPLMCWYSVTEECDLNCQYCFADSGKRLEDELTTYQVRQLLDNIADAGTRSISLGGGEPTLRGDLEEIIRYASSYKFMFVALNTHGQLLNKRYLERLSWAGLRQVKVSVDGLRESHDWNRGSGTFDKCVQSLKDCVEVGIPSVIFIATISQLNYEEIPQMIELTMDMGVDIALVEFLPLGRGKQRKDLVLTKEQTMKMQRYLFEQQKTFGWNRIQFEDRYQIAEDEHSLKVAVDPSRPCGWCDFPSGCITGLWQYCITADGKAVAGDVLVPELQIGDLREQKLSDVWRDAVLLKLLRDRDKLKGRCGRCEYRFICGGCRRRAFSLTGDIMAEDPNCWYKPTLY